MAQILSYLNQIADYLNWAIVFHLKDYAFLAIGFSLVSLIVIAFWRSRVLYIFPLIFIFTALSLIALSISGATTFEWDYILLLAFVNFAAGYILFVVMNMIYNRPQL